MAVYIDSIYPYGDIHEPGWSISGEELPSYCMKRGRSKGWHGATQMGLNAVMPTCYVTRKVYNYIVARDELEGVRSRILGVVENTYAQTVSCTSGGESGRRRVLIPGSIIPCLPEPPIICNLSGSFTDVPPFISILVVDATPTPAYMALPVTLSLERTCTYGGAATSPVDLIGKLPVTLSINDVDLGTYYPNKKDGSAVLLPIDLYSFADKWMPLLTPATTAFKLKARFPKQTMHNMTVSGVNVGDACFESFLSEATVPVVFGECLEGTNRKPKTCWEGSLINEETCSSGRWVPSGETCPVMPGAGATRGETTCWDGSKIYAEKFDAVTNTWIPTGATCPTEPPEGEKRGETTCWDGTVIYAEKFDRTTGTWVPTGATCPTEPPTEGTKRSLMTCWDGSTIHTEIFREGAWVPSGETCPSMMPARVLRMAVPKIVYEGQAIDIVVQAFCGTALSSGEPATLTVDGVDVQTKNTSAGEVKFRWTATGTGGRMVCVDIPVNPNCKTAGHSCETVTVSAYISGIGEQIKAEKAAYEEALARLRELKRIERRPLSERAPGVVKIPASLAGVIVEIGGVPTTIPEGGMPIVVSPGETIVTIIREGIRTDVPVIVPPGGTVTLPELPELPGGL